MAQIEQAIARLPREEVFALGRWLDEQREALWDAQMEEDAAAGKLDFLSRELDGEIAANKVRPLHEVLRHE